MEINPKSRQAYELFHKGTLALARAERQGMRIDVKYVTKTQKKLTKKIKKLELKFRKSDFYKNWEKSTTKKININSNPQLSTYLYKVLKVKTDKKTEKGNFSTNEETLRLLNIPELDILLKINKLKKVRDTFLQGILREQADGILHPFFNLHIPVTYRSSSQSINFQNLPKRDKETMQLIRKAIYPRKGYQLLEMDFGGLEVCISACYNKDKNLVKEITDPNTDMHRDMAKSIFFISKYNPKNPEHKYLRSATKNGFVFPQFYGDYFKNNADSLACVWNNLPKATWKKGIGRKLGNGHISDHLINNGIKSYSAFEKHLQKLEHNFWNKRFFDYRKWKDQWWEEYQEKGYFDMFTGFRCSGVMTKNEATNYPVQGAAFHCLLWSLIRIDEILRKEKWKSKIIGQIHDAIVFDVHPKELKKLVKLVTKITTVELPKTWGWINVPLTIDAEVCPVNGSWAEKEDYVI